MVRCPIIKGEYGRPWSDYVDVQTGDQYRTVGKIFCTQPHSYYFVMLKIKFHTVFSLSIWTDRSEQAV